jgi:hypothetical protein
MYPFETGAVALTNIAFDAVFTNAMNAFVVVTFVDVDFAVVSCESCVVAIACVTVVEHGRHDSFFVNACTILALVPITMVNILIAILSEISRAGAIAFITLHKVIAYTSVCAQVDYTIIDVILAFVSFIACSGAITSKTFDAVYARSMHAIVKKLIVFIETIVYIACAMFSSESCVAAIAFI